MVLSEFHLTLIAAGAGAVAMVWIYNLLQERKHRKAAEKVFRGSQPDVLLDREQAEEDGDDIPPPGEQVRMEPQFNDEPRQQERIEPVLGEEENAPAPKNIPVIEAPELEEISEPDFAAAPPAIVQSAMPATHGSRRSEPDEAMADPVMELAVAVGFDQPSALTAFWQSLLHLPARVAHHLRCIGHRQGRWQEITGPDELAYDEIQLLVQLADRQGPMTEADLVPFIQAVEKAAASTRGKVNVAPVPDVLLHARSLDEFCASVDIQMAVHVVSRSGGEFPGTKLRALLEAGGFRLRKDGLFHLADDAGNTLLSLSNFGATPFVADELRTLQTQGVTFWLDVPRVAKGSHVFDRLVTTARQLADAVDGVLVDDQRRPLADNVLASIRSKIDEIQKSMAQSQMPAGGRRALRLFR
ncbi:MAG: hypothetical protein EKK46_06230 [Rhodocyclaceae bacterium]|nr:MAG: hypothetical protein EKK46_06230 [Rhodocyclaceae bacterium]